MELKNKIQNVSWWKVTLGFLLMPILLTLFIVDRFVMVFMVMSDAPTIKAYFEDLEDILISALRNVVLGLVILLNIWLWF